MGLGIDLGLLPPPLDGSSGGRPPLADSQGNSGDAAPPAPAPAEVEAGDVNFADSARGARLRGPAAGLLGDEADADGPSSIAEMNVLLPPDQRVPDETGNTW
jgi:hypothetical protein